mmetsp:Transcript_1005/g.2895  ORF Transcript_1005/g.2895 Transcript_1005/m.2895 type:complete len:464 (-) Transcript_1005:177-1568(-)
MVSTTAAYATAVTPPGNRPHSIAIFGCTGNAGRCVAYQIIKSATKKPPNDNSNNNNDVHIALSGRDRSKVEKVLEGIRDELRSEVISNDIKVDIVIADTTDEESMLRLAKSTNILVSCAGPYGRYGEAAVKACVEGGAHYVDITGEVAFVERMIADYGEKAEENGVVLCPFSGYDCVPSELGMFLVGKALEMEGSELGNLALNFGAKGGGFPRGTIETILDGVEGKNVPKRRDGDPRFYPAEYRNTAKGALSISSFLLPKYQLGSFVGPNFMSIVNVPVLCRSAPTFGFSSDMTISDKSVITTKPSFFNGYGLIGTQLYIATLLVGGLAIAFPPIRGYIRRKIQGYSFNGDASGKVFVDVQGSSSNGKSSATAKCMFPGDPGIYATGLFAASVANSLFEATSSDSEHRPPAGFHPPVAALSSCRQGLLVDKLVDLGAEIKVEVIPEDGVAAKEIDASKLWSKL